MDGHNPLAALSHLAHKHLIWLVVGSYALASVCPGPGLWVRGVSFGEVSLFGERARLTLPVLLLAVLLFNAGIGARASGLAGLARRPWPLLAGLLANLAVPVGFIFLVSQGMRVWHNPEETQQILVGLALVASMPIAGSSAAWSQNAPPMRIATDLAPQTGAVAAARRALAAAAFAEPRNPVAIQIMAGALREAELALATAFARVQASLDRIPADQALAWIATAGTGAGGGRGGGGRRGS